MIEIPHVQVQSIFTFDKRRYRIHFSVIEQQTLRDAIEAMKDGIPPDNLESKTFTGILELGEGSDASFVPDESLGHCLDVFHACGSGVGLVDRDARSFHIAERVDHTVAWLVSSGYLRAWPEPPRIFADSTASAALSPQLRCS